MGYNTNHAEKFTQKKGEWRLRRTKKVVCVLCAAIFLCGCGEKEESSQKAESEVPVIRMGTITNSWRDEEDLAEISQELGDLTEKKQGFVWNLSGLIRSILKSMSTV